MSKRSGFMSFSRIRAVHKLYITPSVIAWYFPFSFLSMLLINFYTSILSQCGYKNVSTCCAILSRFVFADLKNCTNIDTPFPNLNLRKNTISVTFELLFNSRDKRSLFVLMFRYVCLRFGVFGQTEHPWRFEQYTYVYWISRFVIQVSIIVFQQWSHWLNSTR